MDVYRPDKRIRPLKFWLHNSRTDDSFDRNLERIFLATENKFQNTLVVLDSAVAQIKKSGDSR
jgi:hypothetical protein